MDLKITEESLQRFWLSSCHDWRMIYADGVGLWLWWGQMDTAEIEKRFENEVYWYQLTYQMLDECIFHPDKKYILEPAREFFNRLYMILVDYLCMRIIRMFDPAQTLQGKNQNFSLERVQWHIEGIHTKTECKDAIEKIKKYRNKYLSHSDLDTSNSDFPPYKDFKESIKSLLEMLHDNLDVIRRYNGQDAERGRYTPSHHQSDFIRLISFGSFLHSKWYDPEYRDLIQDYIKWHDEKRSELASATKD